MQEDPGMARPDSNRGHHDFSLGTQFPVVPTPDRLLGASTIRYAMQVLKVIFAVDQEDGLLATKPARPVRVNITTGKGTGREIGIDTRPRALKRKQLRALIAELPTEYDRHIARFLVQTGPAVRRVPGVAVEGHRLVGAPGRPHDPPAPAGAGLRS